jgi:uncharacterized cupredoxin-like copper-binding protein
VTAAAALTLGLGLAAGCGDDAEPLDVATASEIDVVGTEMRFDPDEIAVRAGPVPVTLRNEGVVLHDLRIDGVPFIVEAKPGETASDVVTLEPGTYDVYCSLPGHKEAGMTAVLEVRDA